MTNELPDFIANVGRHAEKIAGMNDRLYGPIAGNPCVRVLGNHMPQDLKDMALRTWQELGYDGNDFMPAEWLTDACSKLGFVPSRDENRTVLDCIIMLLGESKVEVHYLRYKLYCASVIIEKWSQAEIREFLVYDEIQRTLDMCPIGKSICDPIDVDRVARVARLIGTTPQALIGSIKTVYGNVAMFGLYRGMLRREPVDVVWGPDGKPRRVSM